MKRKHDGFTFVEVSIFIAISGLVLISVIGMASLSISQQRVNDATQNFAEFLRRVYSGVENPQGIGDGRSTEYAIYGKLITFGEMVELNGDDVPSDTQRIFVYDVVGKENYSGTGGTRDLIGELNMDVFMVKKDADGESFVDRAGIAEGYIPRWSAVIDAENGEPFKGSILIVRHARSGIISTFVGDGTDAIVKVNETLAKGTATVNFVTEKSLIVRTMEEENFEIKRVDFCVNMNGYGKASDRKQDVRIAANARNASGISIIAMDSDENVCNN